MIKIAVCDDEANRIRRTTTHIGDNIRYFLDTNREGEH